MIIHNHKFRLFLHTRPLFPFFSFVNASISKNEHQFTFSLYILPLNSINHKGLTEIEETAQQRMTSKLLACDRQTCSFNPFNNVLTLN